MKRVNVALLAVFMLGLFTQSAFALPAVCKQFLEKAYADSPIAAAAKEAKCNICHYGKSKKNRNDYGKCLRELGVTKENYEKLKDDPEKLEATLNEIFKKAEAAKSVSGKTFGELIKSGKLPGTAPEGEE